MGIPIRVLIVEDSTDDAELILLQLRRAGYDPVSERVQTAEAMKTALEGEPWDLVVSDYTMPRFDAPEALSLLNQSGLDIPFIVVSGSIGEDTAVEMMRTGAHDYVLKQNLTRLVSAVQRELREAESRRQKKLAEQANQRLQTERNELLERLRQENEDLVALTRLTANAVSTLDLDELLRVLLGRVVEVMRADSATILLAEDGELRVGASAGSVDLGDSMHVGRVGEGFAGAVALRREPVYVEDTAVDPLVTNPLIRKRGLRTLLGVPLKRNGALIGVLHTGWLIVHPRREREVHLLEITAERCAAAIQNARLYQEARSIAADLTKSEAHARELSSAIEQSADAVLITDREGVIRYVNAAFEAISGYSAAEVIGRTPRLLDSGQHPPVFFETLWRTITAGDPFRAEFINRHKGGGLVYEETTITPVKDQHGNITRFVSTAKDVTERRRAEEALRSSLLEKEALLKEVHHRVKNNLQVITSLLRLETNRSGEPAARAVLKDMQGRIQAMALLHETLYRSGTFASVDLGAYLGQLATQSFRALNTEPRSIQLDLDLAPVQVGIDKAIPCGLVLNELISNCLKHGFPDRRTGGIRVDLQPLDGGPQLRLRVSDTGVGLPADFEARRGRSLGLQLVSDLAKQLGGRLEIEAGPGAVLSVAFTVEEARRPE